jgi:hypothetical protein
LEILRKAWPDLAEKVHNPRKEESSSKKVWRPKKSKADVKTSADAHMVFVLPAEFHAPGREEVPVAQLDLGPRPVIFEKPREKNYRHLKALYLRGYINGQPVSRMLVDTGAAVSHPIYKKHKSSNHICARIKSRIYTTESSRYHNTYLEIKAYKL